MLVQRVRHFPPDTTLWITATGASVKSGDIGNWPASQRFAGKKVALWLSDSTALARALFALDGSAARLLLLPPGVTRQVAELLLPQFGPDLILIDDLSASPAEGFGYGTEYWGEERYAIDPAGELATSWVIPTSGTTGTPKLVSHTFRSLTRTVKSNPEIGRQFRWGQLYDLARFAGLQVFLNSILSGSTLVFTRATDSLGDRVAHLARHECNAISATPTLWRKILMTPASRELNPRQITLGGEIVDQQILNALRAQYPAARISHIYASTEAGAAFSVNDGQAGFPSDLLKAPPSGLELRVNEDGYLLIRPELREQSYLSNDAPLFDDAGFVNTGDLVACHDERIFFRGRANGTINVGGNKVPPEEVESVLHAIPGVRLARVYGKRSSITGTLVAADVQAEAGITELDALRRAITSQCVRSLAEYKVPAIIRFVSEVEINGTGKVVRQ